MCSTALRILHLNRWALSHTVSLFSLFQALYNVPQTLNDRILNHAPRGNAGLGFHEPLVTTFPSINQYITLSYVCFCLKTPHLIYPVDSLTLHLQPTML